MTALQRAARIAINALAAEAGVDPPFPPPSPWSRCCGMPPAPFAVRKTPRSSRTTLFLKRLSDVFDDEIARLAEEYGDRAATQEIAESDHKLLRFYLPPEARWAILSGREAHHWPPDGQGAEHPPARRR